MFKLEFYSLSIYFLILCLVEKFEKWVKKYVRNSLRTYWIPGPGKEPEKRIKYNMSKNIQERLERHFAKVKYNKQNKQYKYARNFTKA